MPNLYMNPSLNAPLGPDGLPVMVDPKFVQEDYEVWRHASIDVNLHCNFLGHVARHFVCHAKLFR
jgi:hypothetical protein